jgi:transcriptional regulator with XRE-family HTH domain
MPKLNPFVLKSLRHKKGWSLDRLSEMTKVDRKTLWRIEHNKSSECREHTARQIAEAFQVEISALIGDVMFEESIEPIDASLSRVTIEISTLARNAMYLVGDRYCVPRSSIVELAPFLFHWAAETSLRRRRDQLEKKVRRAPNEDVTEEMESIEIRDLFGDSVIENPFETFLSSLIENVDADASLNTFNQFDYADYRICVDDAVHLVGGDAELAEEVLQGRVRLQDMPKELFEPHARRERVQWVRTKAQEYRDRLSSYIESRNQKELPS